MALMQQRDLSKLEKQGVVQRFEYCYELGWNTLKDFLAWQGIDGIVGSRDTIREAFGRGLISDGHGWMYESASRSKKCLKPEEHRPEVGQSTGMW